MVSDEYNAYNKLKDALAEANVFPGYQSHKAVNDGLIDYKIQGKDRYIKNDKLNSYLK